MLHELINFVDYPDMWKESSMFHICDLLQPVDMFPNAEIYKGFPRWKLKCFQKPNVFNKNRYFHSPLFDTVTSSYYKHKMMTKSITLPKMATLAKFHIWDN